MISSKRTLALMLLSVTILSYGLVGPSYAQGPESCVKDQQVFQGGECVDVSSNRLGSLQLVTDTDTYTEGSTITISGNVTISQQGGDVTILVRDKLNTIMGVKQIPPIADGPNKGMYSTTILAQGASNLWQTAGEYTVIATYGAATDRVTFEFTGGSGTTTPTPPPPVVDPTPPPPPPPPVEPTTPPPPPPPPVEPTPPPPVDPIPEPNCGPGTKPVDGVCVVDTSAPSGGGGCLIATATFGSELAPQVQFLREVRDDTLLSTASGASFMTGFNNVYYAFSPTVADWERENPMFKQLVKTAITPMISSLGILTLADQGSEFEVLALGMSVIALNLGMYIAAPAFVAFKVSKHFKSKTSKLL